SVTAIFEQNLRLGSIEFRGVGPDFWELSTDEHGVSGQLQLDRYNWHSQDYDPGLSFPVEGPLTVELDVLLPADAGTDWFLALEGQRSSGAGWEELGRVSRALGREQTLRVAVPAGFERLRIHVRGYSNEDNKPAYAFTGLTLTPGAELTLRIEGEGRVESGGEVIASSEDPANRFLGPQESLELNAVPAPGWQFSGWQGQRLSQESTFTAFAEDLGTVTAIFVPAEEPVRISAYGLAEADLPWLAAHRGSERGTAFRSPTFRPGLAESRLWLDVDGPARVRFWHRADEASEFELKLGSTRLTRSSRHSWREFTIDVPPGPQRYLFLAETDRGWDNEVRPGTVWIDDLTVEPLEVVEQVLVEVTADPGLSISQTPTLPVYREDNYLTVQAQAQPGYTFKHWEILVEQTHGGDFETIREANPLDWQLTADTTFRAIAEGPFELPEPDLLNGWTVVTPGLVHPVLEPLLTESGEPGLRLEPGGSVRRTIDGPARIALSYREGPFEGALELVADDEVWLNRWQDVASIEGGWPTFERFFTGTDTVELVATNHGSGAVVLDKFSIDTEFAVLADDPLVRVTPQRTSYLPGTEVTFSVNLRTGQQFLGWEGDLAAFGTTHPLTLPLDQNIVTGARVGTVDETGRLWETGGTADLVFEQKSMGPQFDFDLQSWNGRVQYGWMETEVTGPINLAFTTELKSGGNNGEIEVSVGNGTTEFYAASVGSDAARHFVRVPAGDHRLRLRFNLDGYFRGLSVSDVVFSPLPMITITPPGIATL
ncbi:MAG: hypothetical protein ACFB21_14255, partial [Opitutales bacterium]